jgi:hypothetical protein
MPDKNEIVALLERLICTVDLNGCHDVVWTSEKINIIADKLLEGGFVKKTECTWKPLGQRVYGGGRSYTHYCSGCGKHGYDDDDFCPGCGAIMKENNNQD